jgi:thiol-disulfide isomerase/thioredoxin
VLASTQKIVSTAVAASFLSGWFLPKTLAQSQGPSLAQVLAIAPRQQDVPIDQPSPEQLSNLRLETYRSGKLSGWMVRRADGSLVRFFLDTDGDNVVDQWRFYREGREVYRDMDTNRNGRPDQYRWFHEGGTRWGIDANEDGVIEAYRVLSLEELLLLTVDAVKKRNFALLQPLLVQASELAGRPVPASMNAGLQGATMNEFSNLLRRLSSLAPDAEVERVDFKRPYTIPGTSTDGTLDLTVYERLLVVIRHGPEVEFLEFPWVVKVGDAWKLGALPRPASSADVVISDDSENGASQAAQVSQQLHALLQQLQKLDQSLLAHAGNATELAKLHLARAALLEQLAQASSSDPKTSQLWLRQMVDSVLVAHEANLPEAETWIKKLREEVSRAEQAQELEAYLEYHLLSNEYTRKTQLAESDFMSIQRDWVRALETFLSRYGGTQQAAEAWLHLGIAHELLGNTDKAQEAYSTLVKTNEKAPEARRAQGALRRLTLGGKSFDWKLLNLPEARVRELRGKTVVVYFWAPWCEPCKKDLIELASMQSRYGSDQLAVVNVVLDKDVTSARAYLSRLGGSNWVTLTDPDALEGNLAAALGIFTLPTAILVGPDGTVVDRDATLAEIRGALDRTARR